MKPILAIIGCAILAAASAAVAHTEVRPPILGATAHVGTADFEQRDIAFTRMREAGLKCARFDLGWRLCQPTPDAPLDFSRYDRVFESAGAEGVGLLPILNWAPRWAVPVTEHLGEWRAFVRAAAERYRGRVAAWEVWNEPNHRAYYPHGDAKAYLEMLRAAREEIKAADPDALVCCGGLAGADSAFLEALYNAGAKGLFDVFAVHPYCAPQPPEYFLDEALGRMRGVMERHGDGGTPIWITEMGWSTYTASVPEQTLLMAGLRVARPDLDRWRVGCVGATDDTAEAETVASGLREALPPGSTAKAYTPAGLCAALAEGALDAVVYPPFTESFPLDTLEAVRDFVADGGTLVDFGGAPMWYAYRDGRPADTLPGGGLAREAAWDALRVSVVFPGKESGIPAKATVHATTDALAAGMPDDMNGWPCHRFFDAAKLKKGDRLVPLLAVPLSAPLREGGGPGGAGGSTAGEPPAPPKAAGACVLKFGSDYRGAVILSGNMAVETGGVSEAQQADYILRALPVAAKHGVERFLIYALRNSERNPHDREDHFGIVHADFSPKPAFLALRDFRRRQDCGGPLSGSRQAP